MTPISLAAIERWHATLDEPGWAVCAVCNVPYPCDPMRMVKALQDLLDWADQMEAENGVGRFLAIEVRNRISNAGIDIGKAVTQ